MESYSVNEMYVGQKAEFTKVIAAEDIDMFSAVTGDCNPVHIDSEFAKTSIFGERIAHGMLSAGLISAALGTRLPGVGAIYLTQSLKFTAPVKIGDTVTAEVEVLEIDTVKNRVRMRTVGTNQNGVMVVEGEALLKPNKKN